MAAKKVESLESNLEKYHEEVKGNFAALGNKLDSEAEALRKRQELEDKRYEEVKNMLLSLTNKDTSYVKPVEPLKKVQTGLKFDDLGFSIPPTNTGTSADGGRKKISEIMGEDDYSWGDYDGFGGSNRINLDMDDGIVKEKNGVRNTIRTCNGTGANHAEGRFFNQEVDLREQLRAVVLCMEGQALSWFRWSEARAPFRSWEELKRRLLDLFQPSQEGNLHEQFLSITQDGIAREYVGLFKQLAGQPRGVSEEVMEGTFIKGLKPDLRSSVRVMQPAILIQTVTRKDQLQLILKGLTRIMMLLLTFKRLTDAEFANKRAKGICFWCDEKFGPGHRCPRKTLQVLLVGDEDEIEDEFDE
ncbi:ankyrin repeat-containing protein [Tanacetum coccineum]